MYYNLATVDACHALGLCVLNKNVLSLYTVKPKIAVKIKRGNQELKYNAVLLSHLPRESLLLCNRQVKEQLTSIDEGVGGQSIFLATNKLPRN